MVPQETGCVLEDHDGDVGPDLDLEVLKVGVPPSPPLEEVEFAFRRSFLYQISHSDVPTSRQVGPCAEAQQYLRSARVALVDKFDYRHPLMPRTKMDGSLEDDAWSGTFEPLRRIASNNTTRLEDTHGWVEETNVVNEGAADQPEIEELSDSSSDADEDRLCPS
jgi:hypothetical protein